MFWMSCASRMYRQRFHCMLVLIFLLSCGLVYFTTATDTFFGRNSATCESEQGCEPLELTPPGVPREALPETKKMETHELNEGSQEEIHVIITFTNAAQNYDLQKKFARTVQSLFKYATTQLAIYILGDADSHKLAEGIMTQNSQGAVYRVMQLDVDHIARDMDVIIQPMQHHFSYKPGAYYNHALFFVSIAMHRVLPQTLHRIIMLDADLKFRDDISLLYKLFDDFTDTQVLGIARENQPVYRHAFSLYRSKNPGTRVGGPPPDGLTGFNSGVLLLDLDKMRQSTLYNSCIDEKTVAELTEEFHFKGHLGDQDFFTLLNMKFEELFFVLPCEWNRQLCVWWKDKGYSNVFHMYYTCDADAKICHGNCNTPIPED